MQRPDSLERLIGNRATGDWVVLDEIQKVPSLLDEVHRLMEKRGWRFALCGSSARKLRRGGANMLGGRALTRNMEPFTSVELGAAFDMEFCLQWGMLPFVHGDPKNAADILSAYVDTYLRQEITEEGLIRKLAPFARFLSIAGQMNGQTVNGNNLARDAAVPRSSVETYFSILNDTLLGHFLPAYRPGLKVRESVHPKFYWVDPGIARAAAGLLRDPLDRLILGASLETLVFHELRVYNEVSGRHRPLFYYRTVSGSEIDFVIETRRRQGETSPAIVCIEVKLADNWDRKWENPMREVSRCSGIEVVRMFGVYTGDRAYADGNLEILPVDTFLRKLQAGEVF